MTLACQSSRGTSVAAKSWSTSYNRAAEWLQLQGFSELPLQLFVTAAVKRGHFFDEGMKNDSLNDLFIILRMHECVSNCNRACVWIWMLNCKYVNVLMCILWIICQRSSCGGGSGGGGALGIGSRWVMDARITRGSSNDDATIEAV